MNWREYLHALFETFAIGWMLGTGYHLRQIERRLRQLEKK